MARYLIDSDLLISYLRGRPTALNLVKEICKEGVPAISSLSYFEIWVGVRPHEEMAVLNFISSLWIMSADQFVAKEAGNYVRAFRKQGVTLSSMDALIAATAKVNDLILVTSNTRHFPMTDIQKRSL